jgi:hypothetical protein
MSTDVSEVRAASNIITLMMEAARTCETSVDNYFTRQYILEDKSELHTRRRENLKSHNSHYVHTYICSYLLHSVVRSVSCHSWRHLVIRLMALNSF